MLLLLTSLALADIPPGPDYVETCTIKDRCPQGGVECGANFQKQDACESWASKGYTRACKTWGASAWTEVWCPPKAEAPAPSPVGPAPVEPTQAQPATSGKDDRGCSHTGMLGWAGWGLLALRRRRS